MSARRTSRNSAVAARGATPRTNASSGSRIVGAPVPPLVPDSGPVPVLCVGEAPGPRGADKSGVPFFGDRAGLPLYRALVAADACTLPPQLETLPWDGAVFAAEGLRPLLRGVAVGNAFPCCPTNDGQRFRAPSRAELQSRENRERLRRELDALASRGLSIVLALGRVATDTLQSVVAEHVERWPNLRIVSVPHPSAQGLLSAAPERGKGARLADLAAAWEANLAQIVRASREAP